MGNKAREKNSARDRKILLQFAAKKASCVDEKVVCVGDLIRYDAVIALHTHQLHETNSASREDRGDAVRIFVGAALAANAMQSSKPKPLPLLGI